ncbi:helix-turn-helix domain-containing protein [Kaistia defluvii]|uniref:helix-turn-helix domain-containing protein n=1 Tax=Kaistia defluvii TaxID=410841 RepID=UPI003399285C
MTRARRFIRSHLLSADLCPELVGRELAISRTRLYEMFEGLGGVQKYIRERRLVAAHAMLADASEFRKISDIAIAIGFDSSANFSRAFTQHFGYSPSTVRKLPTASDIHMNSSSKSIDDASFEALLRTLELR